MTYEPGMSVFFPEAMRLVRWETRPPYLDGLRYAMEYGMKNTVQKDYLWETFRFAKYLRDVNEERGFRGDF